MSSGSRALGRARNGLIACRGYGRGEPDLRKILEFRQEAQAKRQGESAAGRGRRPEGEGGEGRACPSGSGNAQRSSFSWRVGGRHRRLLGTRFSAFALEDPGGAFRLRPRAALALWLASDVRAALVFRVQVRGANETAPPRPRVQVRQPVWPGPRDGIVAGKRASGWGPSLTPFEGFRGRLLRCGADGRDVNITPQWKQHQKQ